MPSKQKSRKTPSKPSFSDRNSIFSSPSAASTSLSSPFEPTQEQLLSSLDEAAAQFPSLISREAFVGTIVDDAVSNSRDCKIWLSESAMVSSSIRPGSLVSVSLSSFDKGWSGFPLSDLSYDCAQCFGFDLTDNFGDEPGRFFALATVFHSLEVLETGVRLSLNFSQTLGCPRSGRIVFVCPVKRQTLTENGNGDHCVSGGSYISIDSCQELYLSLVYLKGKDETEISVSSSLDLSNELAYGQIENINVSSPKTPCLSESRVSSPCSTQSRTLNYEKSSSKRTYLSNAAFNILDMEKFFRDDSSRKPLEICTAWWLSSRSLLSGNFVTVPILSELCVFQVTDPKRLPLNREIVNSNSDFPAGAPDKGKYVLSSFSTNSGTKIIFLSVGNPIVETSLKSYSEGSDTGHGSIRNSKEDTVSKLGGLSKEYAVLKGIIVSSAVQTTLTSLGLQPTKGVLLHGPPGTGKTTLARVCAHDSGVNIFSVNGPEIISQYNGETEQALQEVFDNASKASPAVVFIDELDAIAPARKDGGDELSQRLVATLLNLMDGISRTNGVLVISATNRPDSIEPALRRPGRLDREIEIGVPSPIERREILLAVLNEMQHSLLDEDIQNLAMNTHGFVGADLAALCNEAALVRLREYAKSNVSHGDSDYEFSTVVNSECQALSQSQELHRGDHLETPLNLGESKSNFCATFSSNSEGDKSSNFLVGNAVNGTDVLKDALRVTSDDFEKARIRIRPSAMREVILEIPRVRWEDVGGQMEVKTQLMEAVQWPQKHKDAFKRIGTRPPSGVLLFGPPGCSKTLLARAVTSEAGLNFLAVKGPELFSKWVGESEKAVRSLFAKARMNAPSIIFFDEIDGLAITRGKESDGVSVGDRVISQLLVELDGLQQRGSVTVIAATNRPDKIDPALLRPGRFDRLLYVGPPSKEDREDIFRVHLQRMPCSSDVCISELSLLTEGYTGADISLICREAAIKAIKENRSASEITIEHLKAGIQQVQPSNLQMFENLSTKFQRLVHSTAKKDDLEFEPCPNKPSHISLWNKITSAVLFLSRLPGFILRQGSS